MANENYRYFESAYSRDLRAFLCSGFRYARELYGEPRFPVNHVYLCFGDRPIGPMQVNHMPLMERNNLDRGLFTIYIDSHWELYDQVSQEIGHLLNVWLVDCYIEGLNSVFAEKLFASEGLDWSCRRAGFYRNKEEFYAATYFMMKEVSDVAGEENMRCFLKYAVQTNKDKRDMHVDINAWLRSLPMGTSFRVKKFILQHRTGIERVLPSSHACSIPDC